MAQEAGAVVVVAVLLVLRSGDDRLDGGAGPEACSGVRVHDLDVGHAEDAPGRDAGGVRAAAVGVEVGDLGGGDPVGLALVGPLLAHSVVVALDGGAEGLVGERYAHDGVIRGGQGLEAGEAVAQGG